MARLPPLNWLRTFEAAARHRNFTRAGEELGLTQAAVSKHIQNLESWLRQPLFERLPHSLKLTPHGENWLPMVQLSLRHIADGIGDVFGSRDGQQLLVSINIAWATLVVAPRLHEFVAQYPGVHLRITHEIWTRDAPAQGVELEVRYGEGNWPGLQAMSLADETLRPMIAADADPDGWQQRPRLKVLGYRSGWAEWCAFAGETLQTPQIEFDQSLAAYIAAANGLGVVLGRRSLARDQIERGELRVVDDRELPISESFHVCWRSDRALTPLAANFRDWLISLRE